MVRTGKHAVKTGAGPADNGRKSEETKKAGKVNFTALRFITPPPLGDDAV